MTKSDRQWLDQHRPLIYVSSRMTSAESLMMYHIYNRLTGENKKPNGCGSCMRNTIKMIRYHYEKN